MNMQRNRRSFLKTISIITSGSMCGVAMQVLQGCASYRSLVFTDNAGIIAVPRSQFKVKKDGVINFMHLPSPIYLKEHSEDEYTAVLLECTHKQCEVSPTGRILICPCHGSEFSDKGSVLTGPAEQNLYNFKVTLDKESIYVRLTD